MFDAFSIPMSLVEAAAAWLLTYGIHSTLLLTLAAGLSGFLPLPSREALWKTALVGGLFTATLQLALAGQPVGGSWSVRSVAASLPTVESARFSPPAAAIAALAAKGSMAAPKAETPQPGAEVSLGGTSWPGIAVAFWAFLGSLGLGGLAISYRRLMKRLSDRREVTAGTAAELLRGLKDRRNIRGQIPLFRSEGLGIPIAHGVLRGKICIPGRALRLPEEEQESLLAHELAHVARRDPLWLLISRALERVFFFQPLHRLARRRLQQIAEFRCDDWAAEATGRPLSLARCLTEVAGWRASEPYDLPASAMAVRGSGLSRRVRRLVHASPMSPVSPWSRPLLAVLLLAVVAVAPGFTGASLERENPASTETPANTETPAQPEAPPAPPHVPSPAIAPQVAQAAPEAPEAPRAPEAPKAPRAPTQEELEIPEINLPEMTIPEIQIPEIQIPEIRIPEIRIPAINFSELEGLEMPDIQMPDIQIPEILIPEIRIPEISVPEIRIPQIHIPKIQIPDLPPGEFELSQLDPETREEIRREIALAQAEVRKAQEEIETQLGPEMERVREEMESINERVHTEVRRALEDHREAIAKAQAEVRRGAEEARKNKEARRQAVGQQTRTERVQRERSVERRLEAERAKREVERHQRVQRNQERGEKRKARDEARRHSREERTVRRELRHQGRQERGPETHTENALTEAERRELEQEQIEDVRLQREAMMQELAAEERQRQANP